MTIVNSNPKVPFSIATTLQCRRGHNSFSWIALLTLDPYLKMLSVKHGNIKNHFLSHWSTWDWPSVSLAIGRHSNHYANGLVKLHIYIYIYCHPQTDCFVLSELFSVAWHVERSKLGLKPIQLCIRLSLRPLGQQAYHVWLKEFLRYYVVTAAAICLHFYTLLATRVLNSFEEFCIMQAVGKNSFTRLEASVV